MPPKAERLTPRATTATRHSSCECDAVAEDDVPVASLSARKSRGALLVPFGRTEEPVKLPQAVANQQRPRSDMWQCNAQALQHPSRCKIGAVDPETGKRDITRIAVRGGFKHCFRSKGQLNSVAQRGQVLMEHIACRAVGCSAARGAFRGSPDEQEPFQPRHK